MDPPVLEASVYSVNVPVPAQITAIATELDEDLAPFDRVIEDHTLVVKRLGRSTRSDLAAVSDRIETVLDGWGPIAARVDGIDVFADPPAGPAPVVYLAVESPGLEVLHVEFAHAFGIVDEAVEGANYVPHVTLARGGNRRAATRMTGVDVNRVDWTVESLVLYDANANQSVTRFSLPPRR